MENKLDKVVITWLNDKFGNLTEVVRDDKTIYINEDRLVLFYYYQDEKNGCVYINYDEIWSFLKSIFGLESLQIKGIITHWLEETYNLKGLTPAAGPFKQTIPLEETYNLKGLTPYLNKYLLSFTLEETYNLKGITPHLRQLVPKWNRLEETYNLNH